jgi:DNA polymerase-3 subunit delta'
LARIFTCTAKGEVFPCEICSKCISLEKGTYQDLYKLEPASKSRRITIGKENEPNTMRWFQSRFYYSSMVSDAKKIGIIFEADRLVTEAQNAFLKTLEEPPKNSNFILVTGNRKMLLPTILSRCQFISVVTNKITYDFKHSEKLFSILHDLLFTERSITKADLIITSLTDLFSSLNSNAQEEISAEWKEELEKASEMDSLEKKQFNAAFEAAVASSYLLKRDKIINAIYVWFSEIYQMSLGVSYNDLANPEIFNQETLQKYKIDIDKASKLLGFVERFSSAMKFNIDESLAIHELVMNSIFKT